MHNGHTKLMRNMLENLNLDKLIMIPSGQAPHKSSKEYAPPNDRLNMCRLAIEDIDGVEVSDWELGKSGPSYTIETVRHFSKMHPNDELFLAMGGDMLLTFTEWESWREILSISSIAAVSREDNELPKLEEKAKTLRQYGRIILLKTPNYTISSTEIRELAANGKDFSCYLPKKVVEYILSNKIYS